MWKNQKVADFFQHLAWAVVGQECDCGHNQFNGLARWCDKIVNAPGQWDYETLDHTGIYSRTASKLYDWLVWISQRFDPPYTFNPVKPEEEDQENGNVLD